MPDAISPGSVILRTFSFTCLFESPGAHPVHPHGIAFWILELFERRKSLPSKNLRIKKQIHRFDKFPGGRCLGHFLAVVVKPNRILVLDEIKEETR